MKATPKAHHLGCSHFSSQNYDTSAKTDIHVYKIVSICLLLLPMNISRLCNSCVEIFIQSANLISGNVFYFLEHYKHSQKQHNTNDMYINSWINSKFPCSCSVFQGTGACSMNLKYLLIKCFVYRVYYFLHVSHISTQDTCTLIAIACW